MTCKLPWFYPNIRLTKLLLTSCLIIGAINRIGLKAFNYIIMRKDLKTHDFVQTSE